MFIDLEAGHLLPVVGGDLVQTDFFRHGAALTASRTGNPSGFSVIVVIQR
jgi:hypothetical protein